MASEKVKYDSRQRCEIFGIDLVEDIGSGWHEKSIRRPEKVDERPEIASEDGMIEEDSEHDVNTIGHGANSSGQCCAEWRYGDRGRRAESRAERRGEKDTYIRWVSSGLKRCWMISDVTIALVGF